MANKKISELTTATSLNNTDQFPIVQSSFTKKTLFQTIKTAIQTITGLTAKSVLSVNDELLINDSAESFSPKKVTVQTVIDAVAGAGIVPVFKEGCTLSNNGGDPTNDIDIAVGKWTDSTLEEIMELESPLTIQLDVAGLNGLDTGAKANSTWYYVYLIKRLDNGTVSGLFSASATSPTLPANYSVFRKIGAVVTDGAGAIRGFFQKGNDFTLKLNAIIINGVTASTSAVLTTVICPPNEKAKIVFMMADGTTGATTRYYALVSSPLVTDSTVSVTNNNYIEVAITGYRAFSSISYTVQTDSSSRVRYKTTSTSSTIYVQSYGYEMGL